MAVARDAVIIGGGHNALVAAAYLGAERVLADRRAAHHVAALAHQRVQALLGVPHGYADNPDGAALAAYADRVIARLETVAPGFTGSVLHRQVIGPREMQQQYGLVGGNIFHGELSIGQMFHARPAAGYADFRTPVRGLYQAGSGTHGGGGVSGIPGRNAVHQILADRRAARWRRRAVARLIASRSA
jgi:phytoene dehydrogenase-like protein